MIIIYNLKPQVKHLIDKNVEDRPVIQLSITSTLRVKCKVMSLISGKKEKQYPNNVEYEGLYPFNKFKELKELINIKINNKLYTSGIIKFLK